MLVYWLDILGTAVFAISGVLLAGNYVWIHLAYWFGGGYCVGVARSVTWH